MSNPPILQRNSPDKLVPPVLLRDVLQCLELPCRHRTRANIPDPTLLNHIVQRLHNLFPRCVTVQAVNLQNIDVGTKALGALFNGVEDVLPAETNPVDHLAVVGRDRRDGEGRVFFVDAEVAFREEDDLVARDVVLLEGFADDLLGDAVGVDVGLDAIISPNAQSCCVLEDTVWRIG